MNVATENPIELKGLCKSFGEQKVLVDVSLKIPHGQFVCLLGASGCGKSTLLRILSGLDSCDSGSAELNVEQQDRGFVFQQPNLLPWRRVLQNIALPLQLRGVSKSNRNDQSLNQMAEVGLTPADAKKWPGMLSGGMQMRASLARTLVTQPRLLLLDEPFSALDEVLRQRLNEDLRVWHAAKNWTTVFVTHNVSEAVFLADRIVILRNTNVGTNRGKPSVALDLENKFASSDTRTEGRTEGLRESEAYLRQVVSVSKKFREVTE